MAVRLSNTIKILNGNAASPEVFSDNLGHVIDVNGPALTNERVEVTDGDSPLNSKEYLSGRQDLGPLTFNINFDFQEANHMELITDGQADPPTVRNRRLQPSASTGDYAQGPAFVSSFSWQASSRDTALTAAVGLQPTSAWSFVAGA